MFRTLIILLIPVALLGNPPKEKVWTTPWFTGPLLAPSASVNKLKQVTWQPYLFVTNHYGVFDNSWKRKSTPNLWAIEPLIDITYGLASFMDLETTPSFSYQTRKGSSSLRMNDTPFFLGFQALRQCSGTWIPDLRIQLLEIFPFGQYDKSNPKKHGTDLTGNGSYKSGISFVFQKTFKMAPEHYFRLRWSAKGDIYLSTVHVKGINAYGGSSGTEGKVHPGRNYNFFLSGEYTITHNWGFAFDTQYSYTAHDRFSGRRGGTPPVGNASSHQISFAPAVEYNYSANFGLIGGLWFSLFGKNSTQFCSGVISAVISY